MLSGIQKYGCCNDDKRKAVIATMICQLFCRERSRPFPTGMLKTEFEGKTKLMKKVSIFVLCLLLFSLPAWAEETRLTEYQSGKFQNLLILAIAKSFNLDEEGADSLLKKAIDLEPENPKGYALEAMLHMFAYDMCFTQEQRRKEKEAIFFYTGEALSRGEKRIGVNPKDSQARLAMALAKVARVYWAIQEKRYIVMAQETLNIWNYLEAAKSADPNNYDVDYLMGLLHYHIDHYRGMTGFLSSLLITEGNRQKGLQEIQQAAQKGWILRDMAQAQLASIYLTYEKQPSRALPIMVELVKKYPGNYSFQFMHALVLVEMRRFTDAEAIAAQIQKNIASRTPPYTQELEPRYYHLMGRIHFKRSEFGRAESYFQKAIQDKSFYNIRTTARSLLYIGMIHDVRLERKYAEDYYQRVLKVEGGEGSARIEAAQYLKTPYRVSGNG